MVKDNFKFEWNNELRDNSKTFILSGCYSARTKIKQANTEASYKLNFADQIQKKYGSNYDSAINYAYKLLLQNQAHDGICGCSTDDVHRENLIRYKKVNQIAETVLKELKQKYSDKFLEQLEEINKKYRCVMEFEDVKVPDDGQIISQREGFVDSLLYDTQRIPVTEDYTTIFRYLKEIKPNEDKLGIDLNSVSNSYINAKINGNQIIINDKVKLDFVRFNDLGDTYNFGADENDSHEVAGITGTEIIADGNLRVCLRVKTSFFDVDLTVDKGSELLKFSIDWNNSLENKLWQARFSLQAPIYETYSEDMNKIIKREFDPYYNIREHLPKTKGIEVKTNFAPMQRFTGTQGLGIITGGLTEYEVFNNTISVTLLRSTGIISNPKNPSRSTPAGPPVKTPDAQQLGYNKAEFAIGFFEPEKYINYLQDFYLELVNYKINILFLRD